MSMCHIVCFGNELHGDDGFGIRVYEALCRQAWPNGVEVFNAGVAGLNALRFLENCRRAILVDALANFGSPGELYVLKPEDLAEGKPDLSGHGLGIPYLLEALEAIRKPLPDILIVGVEIECVRPFCIGLSERTERAVDETVQLIRGLSGHESL
jgi:hydrogenase maturation protease